MKNKKLNRSGFGHLEMIIVLLVVAIVAFVGYKVVSSSHADSLVASTKTATIDAQALTVSTTEVSLSWTKTHLNGIASYNVIRNNAVIATTKPHTKSYLDTNLTPDTAYSYVIQATTKKGVTAVSAPVNVTTAVQPTTISSCTSITNPGKYVLSADISFTGLQANNPNCISINQVSGVTLDCQNHAFDSTSDTSSNIGNIVSLNQADNITIVNCNFNAPVGDDGIFSVYGNEDTFNDDTFNYVPIGQTFGSPAIVLNANTNTIVDDNTVNNGEIDVRGWANNQSAGDQINSNKIIACPTSQGYYSCIQGIGLSGVGNVASYNYINGNGGYSERVPSGEYSYYGAADGIGISGLGHPADSITVTNNNILNINSCGIYTSGENDNSVYSDNTISGAATCGIGGWYWNSMENDQVSDNTVTNSANLFQYDEDLSGSFSLPVLNFANNSFIGNSYTAGSISPVTSVFDVTSTSTTVPSNDTNDTLANNSFDTSLPFINPTFSPVGMVVDGGGNQWCPYLKGFTNSPQCNVNQSQNATAANATSAQRKSIESKQVSRTQQ